jgi:drug/metabolite transporter (DMT)-like permease
VVAVLTGWLVLGQPLAPVAVLGFALVVLGFALVERRALAEELGDSGLPSLVRR